MSWAMMVLCIVFAVNVVLFLSGSPEVNSPMLGILAGVVDGNYNVDWSVFFSTGRLLSIALVAGIILAVSVMMNPTANLTGNFNTFHVLNVIAISIFISFLAVPNFGTMGIPEPINTVVQAFFGFLVVGAVFGLFNGRN